MTSIRAVLFDLDGTLLDTAPDLIFALNRLREEHDLPALDAAIIKPLAGLGSKFMIKQAFNIDDKDPAYPSLREQFLAFYQQHLVDSTQFFPQVETVLTHLDQQGIPWGIVTNKLTRHTQALLHALNLSHRPACVICGDSLATIKPDPAPILYACRLLKQDPLNCVYVGDTHSDVKASKAAGTKSLVALYGYRQADEDPYSWQADGYIQNPTEIIDWLAKW